MSGKTFGSQKYIYRYQYTKYSVNVFQTSYVILLIALYICYQILKQWEEIQLV